MTVESMGYTRLRARSVSEVAGTYPDLIAVRVVRIARSNLVLERA